MALPITFAERRQVVVFLQNELAGFDMENGILLWGRSYSKGYDEHAAMPLYEEPYLRTMQPFRGGSDLFILHTLNDQAQSRQSEPRPPDIKKPHSPKEEDIECRLKFVTLNYALPERLMKNASVFLTATDLLLFTNYTGLDPIVNGNTAAVGGSGAAGIDYGNFPVPRGINFGIKLTR
jgi:hypothetical protein